MKLFIESGVNIDKKNPAGWRALEIAILYGNLEWYMIKIRNYKK